MHRTILLAAASSATLAAAQMGQAIVQNNCDYTVYMQNTPAAGNGYSIIKQNIAPGSSYSQTWSVTEQGGWSIKLSKIPDAFEENILQYEYTCQDDGLIWYDLSCVNGNIFDHDWEISAPAGSGCDPKQAAYQFWNDDAHGMQASCPQATDITVTLCNVSGGSGNSSSSAAPASSSVAATPAPASSSAAPSSAAPASSSSAPSSASIPSLPIVSDVSEALKFPVQDKAEVDNKKAPAPSATTLVTSAKVAGHNYVATVTELVTHVQDVYVTPRAEPHLRHRHHARHGHQA